MVAIQETYRPRMSPLENVQKQADILIARIMDPRSRTYAVDAVFKHPHISHSPVGVTRDPFTAGAEEAARVYHEIYAPVAANLSQPRYRTGRHSF